VVPAALCGPAQQLAAASCVGALGRAIRALPCHLVSAGWISFVCTLLLSIAVLHACRTLPVRVSCTLCPSPAFGVVPQSNLTVVRSVGGSVVAVVANGVARCAITVYALCCSGPDDKMFARPFCQTFCQANKCWSAVCCCLVGLDKGYHTVMHFCRLCQPGCEGA
jgi:hypothetical protein